MDDAIERSEELSREDLARLVIDFFHRTMVHHTLWFREVEHRMGMANALDVPGAAWEKSYAVQMKRLSQALGFRLYVGINIQTIVEDGPENLVFRMNNCRVQAARKKKGLADYHCKSGGLVEYRGFAEAIDPRIRTSCIACPPDAHPEEWFCAWRFTLGK